MFLRLLEGGGLQLGVCLGKEDAQSKWCAKAGKDYGCRSSTRGSRLLTDSMPEQGAGMTRLRFLTWTQGIRTTTASFTEKPTGSPLLGSSECPQRVSGGTSPAVQWFRTACQCRGQGFDPWFGKIPLAAGQRSLCAT